MKILNFAILIFIISCSQQTESDKYRCYSTFREKYLKENKIEKNNRILLQELLDNKQLKSIDTILLVNVNLIDKSFANEKYGLKNFEQIDCKYIAGFQEKTYDCYITTHFTSEAGDGNRVLQIKTYNKKGNEISSLLIDIKYQHDYDLIPEQYFMLTKENKIILEDIDNIYELSDSISTNNLKLIKVNKSSDTYRIEDDGKIIKQ